MKSEMVEMTSTPKKMKPKFHFDSKDVNIGRATVRDKYTLLVSGTISSSSMMMDDKKHMEYTLEVDSIKIQSGKEKTKAGDAIDKRLV